MINSNNQSKEVKVCHITSLVDGREKSGTATWTRNLITEFNNSFPSIKQFLLHFDSSDDPIYKLPGVIEIKVPLIRFEVKGRRFISLLIFLVRNYKTLVEFDVVHWHTVRVLPIFPFIKTKRTVVTIHDAGIYELTQLRTLANYSHRSVLRLFRRQIHSIIVMSDHAKSRIIKKSRFHKNRIDVVPCATNLDRIIPSAPEFEASDIELQNYILCVSRWQPHKNVESLILGYQIACEQLKELPYLILVGKPHAAESKVQVLLESLKFCHGKIRVVSDLKESQIAFLNKNCRFSVTPSLYEGFGLTVLESMIFGRPAIVHRFCATAEVVNEEFCLVDMRNPREIGTKIIELSTNHKILESISSKMLIHSQKYSWHETCLRTHEIYRKIMEPPAGIEPAAFALRERRSTD